MELVQRDYFKLFQALDFDRKRAFKLLVENQETILLTVVSTLKRSPTFERKEDLFSIEHVIRFADRIRSGAFSQFDTMVIETLIENPDFNRHVDTLISKGEPREHAVNETFLVCVFDGASGPKDSPAGKFHERYLKWKSDRALFELSEARVHDRISKALNDILNVPVDPANKSAYALQLLMQEIYTFTTDYCIDSDDRQIALIILEHLVEGFTNKPPRDIKAEMTKYFFRPVFSDRDFWVRVDLIRRRMAAFFLVSGLHDKLPEGPRYFQSADYYKAWMEDCAGVGSMEQARTLLETQEIIRKDPPVNDKEWERTIKAIRAHFEKMEIRVEVIETDDTPILHVYYSPADDGPSEYPELVIEAPGYFYMGGERHSVKEFL